MSGSDSIYGRATVLERVLLAIINAHTTSETEGRQAERLNAAITALIGPITQRERDLEKALLFMVRQRQKDMCGLEIPPAQSRSVKPRSARSVPELARLAVREVMGCTHTNEVQVITRVLCEMFQKRGRTHGVEPDHVREALEIEAVRRILDELSEWNILSHPNQIRFRSDN